MSPASALFIGAVALAPAALPAWRLSDAAKGSFREIWNASVAERRERVGCIGGVITRDTVYVVRTRLLTEGEGDSLTASAEQSLAECAAPEWMGTVHTHVALYVCVGHAERARGSVLRAVQSQGCALRGLAAAGRAPRDQAGIAMTAPGADRP